VFPSAYWCKSSAYAHKQDLVGCSTDNACIVFTVDSLYDRKRMSVVKVQLTVPVRVKCQSLKATTLVVFRQIQQISDSKLLAVRRIAHNLSQYACLGHHKLADPIWTSTRKINQSLSSIFAWIHQIAPFYAQLNMQPCVCTGTTLYHHLT
jgi:hypothetical protein